MREQRVHLNGWDGVFGLLELFYDTFAIDHGCGLGLLDRTLHRVSQNIVESDETFIGKKTDIAKKRGYAHKHAVLTLIDRIVSACSARATSHPSTYTSRVASLAQPSMCTIERRAAFSLAALRLASQLACGAFFIRLCALRTLKFRATLLTPSLVVR
jgi:hypothetical protein